MADEAAVTAGIIGRELPYSDEAERAVIGAVLNSSDSIAAAAEIVTPDDFYMVRNREIYRVVIELFNENMPADFVTVVNRLNRYDMMDAVGGIRYLTEVISGFATSQNVVYYAQIIKEKATLRRLISSAEAIQELGYNGAESTELILEKSEQLIFDVSASEEQSELVKIDEIIAESYEDIIKNFEAGGKMTGIPTGFDELNKRTGGFHGGELLLVAGRPGMGKSSFAVNIAEHVAIYENIPVAIFNLEMPKKQIVNRILCSQARVNSAKIRTGDFETDDWLKLSEKLNLLANAPLYIDDSAMITVGEIRAKCRRLKKSKKLGLIVVDYIQLIHSSGRAESRQTEVSEITRSLKILAKELDIPVIALSQLSRATEGRSDKRPQLSDLRESGSIEQDADMVMFLYRDDYYNKESDSRGKAECIIAKHRNGETGMFELGWQGEYTKFVNISYIPEDKGD